MMKIENGILVDMDYDAKHLVFPKEMIGIDSEIEEGGFLCLHDVESIVVEEGNPVYRSEGNCLIETAKRMVILGCRNSVIPKGIRSIGAHAFQECELEQVTIPEGTVLIFYGAFMGTSIQSLFIPESVKEIVPGAFGACNQLIEITVHPDNPHYRSESNCIIDKRSNELVACCNNPVVPEGVELIEAHRVFGGLSKTDTIILPASVREIRRFFVDFPDWFEFGGYEKVSYENGKWCMRRAVIYAPKGSYAIQFAKENDLPYYEIYFCSCLDKENGVLTVVKPENGVLLQLDPNAKHLVFPKEMWNLYQEIPDFVSLPPNVESIVVEDGNPIYHSAGNCLIETAEKALLLGCKNSIISEEVQNIEPFAFHGCSADQIIIPEGVTTISYNAFCEAPIKSLSISKSVTTIRPLAFYACNELEEITVHPDNPHYRSENNCIIDKRTNELIACCNNPVVPEGVDLIEAHRVFGGLSKTDTITLPSSVKEIRRFFLDMPNWQEFGCYEEMDETGERYMVPPIIRAPKGSYAISFAVENGLPHEEIPAF